MLGLGRLALPRLAALAQTQSCNYAFACASPGNVLRPCPGQGIFYSSTKPQAWEPAHFQCHDEKARSEALAHIPSL